MSSALVSVLVAVAALTVSACALWYSRQQGERDQARRHEEMSPRYRSVLFPATEEMWVLEVTLLSPDSLTELRLGISNTQFRFENQGQHDYEDGELAPIDGLTAWWNGPVNPGTTVWAGLVLNVDFDEEDIPTMTIEAVRDRDSWTTVMLPTLRRAG